MDNRRLETPEQNFDQLFISPHFERLRSQLIRLFARRGCHIPEDLAQETLTRVLTRLPDVAPNYTGDPAHFVYAVARNVYLEYTRHPRTVELGKDLAAADPTEADDTLYEQRDICLERCIGQLSAEDRHMIWQYHLYDKGAKIDRRKKLADELGMGMNALRIKVYRIRQHLHACVSRCLGRSTFGEMKNR